MNHVNDHIVISTVVLNWNRADLLRKTVESYLSTVSVNYELIIVDNNSEDESREFIKTVCADKPQCHALLLDQNLGGEALNIGMAKTKGEFIHITENDLEYLEGWDRELLSKLKAFPEVGQLSPFSPFHEAEKGEIWTDRAGIREDRNGNVVYLALANVTTSCILRREVWDRGVRWKAHGTKTYWSPDDGAYSADVKKLGYKVAWNNKYVVVNWGHNIIEMTKRLDYYLNNAAGKQYLGVDRLIEAFQEHGYAVRQKKDGSYTIHQVLPLNESSAFARTALWKQWMNFLALASQELCKIIPVGSAFTLIDEDQFGVELISGRQGFQFPEADGIYAGHPENNAAAIQELVKQQNNGAQFLVCMWPCFWWLDYYSEFKDYLRSKFSCPVENDRFIVFDLRNEITQKIISFSLGY